MSRYLHKLPNGRPVNRERFLLETARDKYVIHIGFTDHPLLEERIEAGTWLHSELAKVTKKLVGVDVDQEGVESAKSWGFEAHAADATDSEELAALGLERCDLVIAGEVIEHLDAPGPFLRAMHDLGDRLIVTTPNALQPLICLVPLTGSEMMHPDHVVPAYTPRTLRTVMERNGWNVEISFYHGTDESPQGVKGKAAAGVRWVAGHMPRPYWCDGLIAVARRSAT